MKKSFIFCALLAGIAMMVGCQKEQEGITDSKEYIGTDDYPFWENGDKVNLNGKKYTLEALDGEENLSNTFAQITNVHCDAPYCAFFPSDLVPQQSNIAINSSGTSATATIYLKPHQDYIDANGYQKLDMPMAALTTGTTLYFKNFCSVIRVTVTHNTSSAFDVRSITLKANDYYLAGYATATVTQGSVSLSFSNQPTTSSTITLSRSNNSSMGEIQTSGENKSKSFDIIVPPFNNQNLTFLVETTNSDSYTQTVTGAHLTSSQIAPITLSISSLDPPDRAYLLPGDQFNDLINDYSFSTIQLTKGMWSYYNDPNKIKLSTNDSPVEVWGLVVSGTLKIFSTATYIYANPNSSGMFQNLSNVSGMTLERADEDIYLMTDLVTDMSYMFAGCSSLSSSTFFGIEYFNTSNVTTMAHMFDG